MDWCGIDDYTHSTGQCQLFDVQHDELWVFVIIANWPINVLLPPRCTSVIYSCSSPGKCLWGPPSHGLHREVYEVLKLLLKTVVGNSCCGCYCSKGNPGRQTWLVSISSLLSERTGVQAT